MSLTNAELEALYAGDGDPDYVSSTSEPEAEPAAPEKIYVRLKPNLNIPHGAMFGRLRDIAYALGVPVGWAYCALLSVFAGMHSIAIDPGGYRRANIYCALIGDKNDGKTLSMTRAIAALNPEKISLISSVPSSDRGLVKLFITGDPKDKTPKPTLAWLLLQGELRAMLSKIAIKNSSLSTTLCELWDSDEIGASDRAGHDHAKVRLSILGAIKAKDPAEFRDCFGCNAANGLHDRFVLCPSPVNKPDLDFDVVVHPTHIEPVRVDVTSAMSGRFKRWSQEVQTQESLSRRGRIQFISLKVSMIAASANGDDHLTEECIQAGLSFALWQEAVRMNGYATSDAETQCASIEQAIVEGYKNAGPGIMLRFREFGKASSLYNRYGTRLVNDNRDSLVKTGILIAELHNGKPTGKYMLDEAEFHRTTERA